MGVYCLKLFGEKMMPDALNALVGGAVMPVTVTLVTVQGDDKSGGSGAYLPLDKLL